MSEQRFREQRRKEAAARIWLSYYNRVLYEKGLLQSGNATGWS